MRSAIVMCYRTKHWVSVIRLHTDRVEKKRKEKRKREEEMRSGKGREEKSIGDERKCDVRNVW